MIQSQNISKLKQIKGASFRLASIELDALILGATCEVSCSHVQERKEANDEWNECVCLLHQPPISFVEIYEIQLIGNQKTINKHKQTEKQDGKEQERNRNETQKQKHTNTYKTIIQFHKTQQHTLYICCFCYSICLYVVYCFDFFVSLFLYVCVAFSLLFFHVFLNTR